MNKQEFFEYIKKQYDTEPEYLWKRNPTDAVLRHKGNKKWYAVIMSVSKRKIGLQGDELVDIVNVKCDPEMIASLIQSHGFFPGYHMNKRYWMTILLDGSVSKSKVADFVDWSYDLTSSRKSPTIMPKKDR